MVVEDIRAVVDKVVESAGAGKVDAGAAEAGPWVVVEVMGAADTINGTVLLFLLADTCPFSNFLFLLFTWGITCLTKSTSSSLLLSSTEREREREKEGGREREREKKKERKRER